MNLLDIYKSTLSDFIEDLKKDKNIISILLCGSLYHEFINDSSDINLIVVVSDGKLHQREHTCIRNDIVFNIDVFERTQFIQNLSHQSGNMYRYSYLSDNKIIYSKDKSLDNYLNEIRTIKGDYFQFTIFNEFCEILSKILVIKKWLYLKEDALYAQYQFSMIAEHLAKIEHCLNSKVLDRASLVSAKQINSDLFEYFYEGSIIERWSVDHCNEALEKLDAYFMEHIKVIAKPIIKLFKIFDKNILTLKEISDYYQIYSQFMYLGCNYLSQKNLLSLVTVPVQITKKSKISVEDMAYMYIE